MDAAMTTATCSSSTLCATSHLNKSRTHAASFKPEGLLRYGRRGIRVCERWDVFENFLTDMGPRPSTKHSVERIDVNGNYEPSNCKWATVKEQTANTSRTAYVTLNGEYRKLLDVAAEYGLDPRLVRHRIYGLGWTVERALLKPKRIHFKSNKPHDPDVIRADVPNPLFLARTTSRKPL